jgi:diaminopimelate decarboxylase
MEEMVTLCGPFCESGDLLARHVRLPVTCPGDLVAVPVSGAYHLSMASAYNGFPRPAAVMVADGEATLMQRRETVDDLVRRDLPLARA